MSVTFAAVTPMIAIGMNPDIGLLGIFGATIAAGFITTLLAPLIGRLMPLFPPLVTGVVITSIGLSIIQVGIDWAAGGKGNPQYGNPVYLGISFAVLIFILLITRYAKGFMSNVAVLLGIVFGFLLSWMMNEVNLSGLHDASWFAIVTPMSFGMPIFDPVSILTMTAVLIIVFIESMGMFLALGEIVGRKLSSQDIIRGLRVDGVGTMIGGTFKQLPTYVIFAERRAGQRDARPQPLGVYFFGNYINPVWHGAQNGGAGRLHSAICAGRRGAGDVRHGTGDRDSNSVAL